MDIKVLMDLFSKDVSELAIRKEIDKQYTALKKIKDIVNNFTPKENEFLQKFYLKLLNEEDTKLLEYGENFKHAEYFFIDKFFDNNIKIFYSDFSLKDNLIQYKSTFTNLQNVSVKDVMSGYDKDIVSLYVYIENLAKNFSDFSGDRELRNIFKKKIISFFDCIYKLFKSYSKRLIEKYFNILVYNHPMILVELVKSCINSNDENSIVYTFIEEHHIRQDKKEDGSFETMDKELLLEFVSIISSINPNIKLLTFNKNNTFTLSYIYKKNISNFETFKTVSNKFINDIEINLEKYNEFYEKRIYIKIFLEHISIYSNQNIAKNTLFLSTGNDLKYKKLKEVIEVNSVPKERFEHISLHSSYEYKDIIDGFYNGEFKNGVLKNICKKAINDKSNNYYLLISNINHCDIQSVFGESLELLSDRYSDKNQNAFICTKYSNLINSFENKEKYSVLMKDKMSVFAIPENLYIIATFDLISGDQNLPISIAENFKFVTLNCNYNLIKSSLADIKNSTTFMKMVQKLNSFIKDATKNESLEIDHYVFLKISKYTINKEITNQSLDSLFVSYLEPLLKAIFTQYLPKENMQSNLNSAKAIFDIARW